MDGIINLYKPPGITSHDCIDAVRRLFPGVKAGHAGTLDPAATGVLPICLGRATRIVEYLMDGTKGYRAGIQLGAETDTEDAQGTVLREQPLPDIKREALQKILQELTGTITQIPPAYSAVKHRGRPLYYWARQGKPVQGKARTVKIYRLELRHYSPAGRPHLQLDVECSRGTYIRTLAAEIGRRIGCGAHLWSLERYLTGHFTLKEAVTLEELQAAAQQGTLKRYILSMDSALQHLPPLTLEQGDLLSLKQGRAVAAEKYGAGPGRGTDDLPYRVYNHHGRFQALARAEPSGDAYLLKTVKFLTADEGDNQDGTD